MDKNFLKEQQIREVHKQFMKLCEWSSITPLEEDDDTPQDDNNQDPMNNNQMGNDAPPMGDENTPNDGMDMMGGQSGNQMGNDVPPMGDENTANNGMDMMGSDEEMPMSNENIPMDDEMPSMDGMEDETVIDVDDITNAQEKMNDKVNVVGKDLGDVNDKIESLLQSLSKMEDMINNNNKEIESFKAEFEKRNPTQTEKLNLRALDSYPFNVNPKEYWAEKTGDPNSKYSGFANNDKPTTQEYVITNNDVDDFNEREMANSFDIDDELKQDINKIFGLA